MRRFHRPLHLLVGLACAVMASACASQPAPHPQAPDVVEAAAAADVPAAYGTVRAIEPIGTDRDPPLGTGAVVGGVIGALIGRQVTDSNAGAAVGALGGAIVGHEIEKHARRDRPRVRITVTLDDGSVRHFELRDSGGFRVGDRVRVHGRQLQQVG